MKTVFILGAGASRQAGGPLMSDFLDKAEELFRTKRGIEYAEEAFEDVFTAVSELQGIHAKSCLDLDNFETLFGAIEMAKMTGKFAKRDQASIERLRNSIVTLIVRTIENTITFPVIENHIYPPEPYKELAQRIMRLWREVPASQRPITFITFNYDLALDYALSHYVGSLGGPDYCLSQSENSSGIPLLKLHGSINWGSCGQCGAIVPFEMSEVQIEPFIGHGSWVFDLGTNIDRKQHCSFPLKRCPVIVPPTWNKTDYHGELAKIWSRASAELATAENIFVIGYSLPETDSFFRYLYALGSESPTRIKRFWVFNPDRDGTVQTRFRTMIGRGIEKKFEFINGGQGEFEHSLLRIFEELRRV